jgi:hypothetical protein
MDQRPAHNPILYQHSFRNRAVRALIVAAFTGTTLLAQATIKTITVGGEFKPEGTKGQGDQVSGGRRFRAGAFEEVIVRAAIHMPAATAGDPKLQRLIVRFRTSDRGPRLIAAEVRNGSQVIYRNPDVDISGDYTKRETYSPARLANVWNLGGMNAGSDTFVRLTLSFGGGFDSSVNNGEFILMAVEAEFPRKPLKGQSTIPGPATGSINGAQNALVTPVPQGSASNVIYALTASNELNWYRHEGAADGAFRWAAPAAKRVGTGWDFRQLFSGGDGVIYAVTANSDLMWYRHDGISDGSFRWAAAAGKQVGSGWDFKQVFSGGGGVIYALNDSNQLIWFRHDGRSDGSLKWAAEAGKIVGTGWNFRKLFSGGNGVIYAISENGDLFWFRHDGRDNGSFRWAAPEGKKIGSGWDFEQVFSSGSGIIYVVNSQHELLWYQHEGIADGSVRWTAAAGKRVGIGWDVRQLFSGARLNP